jgi:hypothetical protein
MKIWKSFSGDHSAKLKIVGEFKTQNDAAMAVALIDDLSNVEDTPLPAGRRFSDEVMELLRRHKCNILNDTDVEQMKNCFEVNSSDKTVVITTDETEIQGLIKALINYGAKVNIISRHDYPELY